MARLYFLLVFFLLTQNIIAQRDSLYRVLINTSEDSIKVKVLTQLADTYRYTGSDTLIILTKKAAALALKNGYIKDYANSLNSIANAYSRKGDTANALTYYHLALRIYQKYEIEEGIGSMLNNIGTLYYQSSDYRKALDFFKRSLAIRQKLKNLKSIASTINNIGGAYKELGNYVLALEYFLKGLTISEQLHDTANIITLLTNIGLVYQFADNTDKTIEYGKKALSLSRISGDRSGELSSLVLIGATYDAKKLFYRAAQTYQQALIIAVSLEELSSISDCYISLAHISVERGHYAEAITYYRKGIAYAEKISDDLYIAQGYQGLGNVYMLQQDYQASIAYFEKAFYIAKRSEIQSVMAEVLKPLSYVYRQTGQSKKAYDQLFLYLSYKDSLLNENGKRKIQKLEFDYELQKKQQEIFLLNRENAFKEERLSKERLITFSLGIILFLSVFIIVFLFHARKKEQLSKAVISEQKAQIQIQANHLRELNELKARTFTIISHDLRGPIATLSMLMELMNEKVLSIDQFEEASIGVNKQLIILGSVLDNLLIWSKSQMHGNSEAKPVAMMVDKLVNQSISLLQSQADQKSISLNYDEAGLIAYADISQMDIVLRNLIANAIKFTKENGSVTITTFNDKDKIRVEVKDNGVGMSEETSSKLFNYTKNFTSMGTKGELGTGIGLLLCKEFVEKNGGEIFVTSELGNGSVFGFTLPKANQ